MILTDYCESMSFILRIAAKLFRYLHYIIPFILVVMITFDIFKVIVGQADDKSKKEAFDKATKRFIYAVIIFLIPVIVNMIFKRIDKIAPAGNGEVNATTFIRCWNQSYNE